MASSDSTPTNTHLKHSEEAGCAQDGSHSFIRLARNSLNDDILALVFRFTLAMVKEHFSLSYQERQRRRSALECSFFAFNASRLVHQRTALALVCKQWARVALSSGTLAARLVDPINEWDGFERLLHASQNASLVVDFDNYLQQLAAEIDDYLDDLKDYPNKQFMVILENIHRIKGVNFCSKEPHSTEFTVPVLEEALAKPAPELEVLVIRTPMTDHTMRSQLEMDKPYTFEDDNSFLGDRKSPLWCLVLEDYFIIPCPTNPAFDNLHTLKVTTCTSYMFMSTIIPWIKRGSAGGLKALQKLSFKGLSRGRPSRPSTSVDSDITIASTLGPFKLPKGLKKLTLGGHIEVCAIILKSMVIPATCNIRLLLGANRQGECPEPQTLWECASHFAKLWFTDVGKAPCTEVGLAFDEHRRKETYLSNFLWLSHASETRRFDVMFAQAYDIRIQMLARAFAYELAKGPCPLFSERSYLKLRAATPVVGCDSELPYNETMRVLLRQWSLVKNVEIARYDRARDDALGILVHIIRKVVSISA